MADLKKTADPTAYMREYKRKQYEQDPEKIKTKNKAYYYKYKFGLSSEEMKQYGDLTPEMSKALHYLSIINEKNATLIPVIMAKFTTVV